MQPSHTPPTAPPAVPVSLPKKTPIDVSALKLKMSPTILATLAAAGVKAPHPRPTDAAAEEDALLGLKPAAAVAAPPPKVRKVERAPSSSSSSSASSSSSDEDSSSDASSDSDSDSSDDRSSSSSASAVSSEESEKESTLFDIARSQGLVNKDVLSQVEEEDTASLVPPRPPVIRSFPTDIEKTLSRYRERLNREENLIRIKDDNKSVSLGTSKINYIDPRIVCSWAKAQDVPINKIFSSTIIKKFPWAMNAENFDF
ncbi:DNA topoisomerase type IB small subunit [Leptomonas pyrrhocoris]|uniref:DNA topoisomerase type IB small subunit n=1 Tax=Leptomonas pyrrhocoris TaxID=157538 RepID=A0A0N0DQE5_LEPPY|nr:DNA topoisomerase type IB small subunit [Leptomonas pyrrhocoris]KPA73168.1 DNA topoisomerase type IB small subunit [Leptomonas pyrrhocoris]|eukprot:XP_015651607.1 DNA topoisomerase type IB small subunit [Leptomonas pyrrhocoris]